MSRVAKMPVTIPAGVQITQQNGQVTVQGTKATLSMALPGEMALDIKDGELSIAQESVAKSTMMSGTVRALINNMVIGVTTGFEKKLTLIGVGYRAAVQGNKVNLQVGLSHPVDYPIPAGITVVTPTQTEIIVTGADKKMVGQVAADIRSYRPPEPYKGKGVRYANERVVMKEAKKK